MLVAIPGAATATATGGANSNSLWDEDPSKDHGSILDGGKRVNRKSPAASWILRKLTLEIDHKGEKRFAGDSPAYRLIERWIQQGVIDDRGQAPQLQSLTVTPETFKLSEPQRSVQSKVEALFPNSEKLDVSYWSVYTLSNLVAKVGQGGLLTFLKTGETTVLVRYLDQRVSARLALVPGRPGFASSAPEENPVTPEDLTATIYQLFGMDPEAFIPDLQDRPVPISSGRPVWPVIA